MAKMIYGIALGFFFCSIAALLVALWQRTQEARRTRNELEKRVAERTAELTVTNGILVLEVEDRKQAEQDLRESRARLAGIVDSAMDAIISIDETHRVVVFNSAAEKMFRCPANQALGRSLEQFLPQRVHHAHDEHIRAFGRESGTRRAIGTLGMTTGLRADGEEFSIEASISQISTNGQKLYTIILRDITQRLQAEAALKQAHEELEMRVEQRTAELVAANARLQAHIAERQQMEIELKQAHDAALESARLKSEFLANMSHEIRTPMNGIIGMTSLALETGLSAQQHQYLESIKVSADFLLTIINDILDFSKIEAGKLEFDCVAFSLREMLGSAMPPLGIRAHDKGLELTCHVSADVPDRLVGDPVRLRQVIINLVNNAIKFTERGEVALRVEGMTTVGGPAQLRFAITDTGIGIPAEKQRMIFDSFVQADGSTVRKHGGTGLGLTISSRLVEMMGGEILVDSEVDKGSTFHFTVPLELAKVSAARPAIAAPTALQGLAVLVADDNVTSRRILEEIFKDWQCHSTLVSSGQEALAAIEQAWNAGQPFAAALIDATMPTMDGFAVVKQIKQCQTNSLTSILMLSENSEGGHQARCHKYGISAYINKPVNQSDLLDTLLASLNKQPLHQSRHVGPIQRRPKANRSLRILLAEDNVINQTLALHLLKQQGHTTVVAENGRLALAALEKELFDVVLMDIQMPEMTGFEATAAIREQERTTGAHIPIIAMTAYAMKEDRERCLAAGMDGYLSKPIQPGEFFELLDRLTSASPVVDGVTPDQAWLIESAREKRLDYAEMLASVGGDEETLLKILELFLRQCPAMRADLCDAASEGDGIRLARAAHSLRGGAGIFLTKTAMKLLSDLEVKGKAGSFSETESLLSAFENEMNQIEDELSELAGAGVSYA